MENFKKEIAPENLDSKFFENLEMYQELVNDGQDASLLARRLMQDLWCAFHDVLEKKLKSKKTVRLSDREDLISNALVNAAKALKDIKARNYPMLRGWVIAILKSEIYKYIQGDKKNKGILEELKKELIESGEPYTEDDPQENEEKSGKKETTSLKNIILTNNLSQKEIEILELHYLKKASYKKIAGIMGIKAGSVRQKARRALQKIQKAYSEKLSRVTAELDVD
jgi:RNA polymerase sigma factor (sigma-70 family)